MNYRHSRHSSNTAARWLFGAFAIFAVVVGFLVFQVWQANHPAQIGILPTAISSATPQIAQALTDIAATPSPSGNLATSATPIPNGSAPRPINIVRVAAEKANLVTEIVEVPFSNTEDNWDLTYLHQYAGHLQGTDLIGQGGNFVLAGHVEMKDGSRGPFADIHLLNPGDLITIMSNTSSAPIIAQYKVTAVKTVDPKSLPEIRNHGVEELTLLTCGDWDNQKHEYRTRVIVHAKAVVMRHSLAFDASTRTFKIG